MKDINFYIKEYEKLKDEQHKRIEFRDQMIYLNLGAVGAVYSFVLENHIANTGLLVLPFICFVLGWTYLANDEKISSIGLYLRDILLPIISKAEEGKLSNWEEFLQKDIKRIERKRIQLLVDLLTFCIPGLLAIVFFYTQEEHITKFVYLILFIELFIVVFLGIQFVKYSDIFRMSKSRNCKSIFLTYSL